jgi:hypothetical protein
LLVSDDIGKGEREQTRPSFQIETVVGAGVQMLNPHRLQLAVERFNPFARVPQILIVRPSVGGHVLTPHRHQPHPGRREDTGSIKVRTVAFVAEDGRPRWQDHRQFMNRSQIVIGSRQQVKADWDTVGGTDQMQAPTEELLVLGGAVAAEGFVPHFLAAAGMLVLPLVRLTASIASRTFSN